MAITKLSRILSVYHLFLNCQEVSFQELRQQFEVSEKTSLRDIRLLERAGVLEAGYDRNSRAFYPVSLEVQPMAEEENQTRKKYLEKIRRLCILMARMAEEDNSDGMNKIALYREILPGISDRTRQRDFQELEKLGYRASYDREWPDEPGRWYYEIPSTYGLATMPRSMW
ncbi:MAG: hypothetical protein K2P22_09960 [Lachnospiraceae bacterium]|nr:hypothetical protein [Lachnospiraceae bacterium]